MRAGPMTIEFNNVQKSFVRMETGRPRQFVALSPVTFTIESGEFFSVIGPSGCGKSTLLNVLAGLERPDGGSVTVNGKPVTAPGPDRAVVFQEPGLMPWMTVCANVEYGLKLAGIAKPERKERAMHFLRMVHLSRYADAMPHQLSGGMRQRVSIARGLALQPGVLLMDEPFSALDSQTREVLHDELQSIWQATKTTILFITHNLSEAVMLSDRVMIMTAAPGRIKTILKVPFEYPRSAESEELGAYTAQLHAQIREEVNLVAARELDPEWHPEAPPKAGSNLVREGEGI